MDSPRFVRIECNVPLKWRPLIHITEGLGFLDSAEDLSVSIVVPTKNSMRTIRQCLKATRDQSYPCFIVVVDNFSTDETASIAREYADRVIAAGPERSAQRNIGAGAFLTDVVGFIDSDMVLSRSVVEEVVQNIRVGHVAVVVPEWTSGNGYWARVRAYERSLYAGAAQNEAARFFATEAFEQAGGFDLNLTGPEDWDLDIRVRLIGTVGRTNADIEHMEGDVTFLGACRKKGYYGLGLARFAKKHGSQSINLAIDRPYFRKPSLLINRWGPGLVLLKLGEGTAVIVSALRASIRGNPRLKMGNGHSGS